MIFFRYLRTFFDNFTILLFVMVLLATLWPVQGQAAVAFNHFTDFAIALLFFLHGAKLSRQAIWEGLTHWRLHLVIFAATFVLFPILGLALKPLFEPLLTPALYLGILYICVLPSTVQSSIAFTSIARGNVAAAMCSASASNILGMFLTPVLVGLFITNQFNQAEVNSSQAAFNIVLMLLVPFILGQVFRSKVYPLIQRYPVMVKVVDQGSILLVVYAAFSEAMNEGLWQQLSATSLTSLTVVCCLLLAIVMVGLTYLSRALGFNKPDEIAIVFCGSKKTLASGLPMAKILFVGHPIGMLILPLILFHQIQLVVCGILAARYAKRPEAEAIEPAL
ncbi:bile acid:sodium symporter family protein [Alkanindiges sp. WGS2144]|uniref:bile acid:sodium symporter family protein n=1 Tax=Alkanindiges sp. WGS2144 TaxID=3366808 RepID=UPI003752C48D